MQNSQKLFNNTSKYYSRYRLGFPNDFLVLMLEDLGIKKFNRLLDVGCGTGQLSFPLSNYFKEVIAIDINEEMINEGIRVSKEKHISNIEFLTIPAENLTSKFGMFDLVVIGSAFHWMDRERVTSFIYNLLSTKGGLAIVDQGSIWTGKEIWQREVVNIIKKWLGEDRRAGDSIFIESTKRHEEIVREFPFIRICEGCYSYKHTWDIESIIGYLYSTSFCNRELLGDKVNYFESEIKNTLKELNHKEMFIQDVEINYIFAVK
jgi:ubiquinone/menaquinone biosynthesis C-methylase UbiE